jgi:DNA-binding transcriptional LysR family regulator
MQYLDSYYKKSIEKARSIHNQSSNIIRICWGVYMESTEAGSIIGELQRFLPHTQINLVSPRNPNSITRIENNDIDIAFILEEDAQNHPDISFFSLFKRSNYFMINLANPLSKKENLEITDLKNQSIIFPDKTPCYRFALEIYNELLQKFPQTKVKLLADYDQNALPLVIANTCIAIYPCVLHSKDNGIAFIPYEIDHPMVIGIAWRTKDRSETTLSCVDLIKNFYHQKDNSSIAP